MSLTKRSLLGPYEIVAALGAGGIGDVYRARDTKLGRDVAIKVLPATVTADTERLARFSRETQVLASLNHPNIAAIYHVEDGGGQPALVMELVDGETLADRIARGPIRSTRRSHRERDRRSARSGARAGGSSTGSFVLPHLADRAPCSEVINRGVS